MQPATMTFEDLEGRPVLFDIFDHSCINCVHTRPMVRAWRDRYAPRGLSVVGIHTPEFPSGRDPAVVARAVDGLGVDWPVFLDNEYDVWNAFENRFWPALYLVDPSARVRYSHFGEGSYEETEQAISRVLGERT